MILAEGSVTAIVITFNEERNIRGCLESLHWCDETIVVDAGSTDATAAVAREFTAQVSVREWDGYGRARNFALERARSDWVLVLDADERVPEPLSRELMSLAEAGGEGEQVYEVARRAFFLGKWIRHSGWYPGFVPRFFRRGAARYDDAQVHEKLIFSGGSGRLREPLDHHTDDTLFHYFGKFNRYTSLAAADLHGGRRFSVWQLLVKPPALFLKMYLFRLGVLDGIHGLLLALLSASYVFVKYAKLGEREMGGETPHGPR
jgi:glycosyltransferase involved in cell wall biosynthesis